ncbi:hypothetical protein TVAG_566070 [Trichomonas vaginalis G3]|uniref:Uncharacterized protein n=1 Tax=Trichomonas vaginalis (strain ATCC PRA-98 / G3) TaxID=412133 RepID=A2GI42_TRIV3|nr:hypothetical protein TVAGG3_0147660 [Trichomonas vaginalis G3]EAX83175.1 hypothetical protein TVAG_566070 [Trichomonas vaginalis G3]KAI5547044.1 hypothetical protein TVAGG3_0147660 [Trichomonas vaginalis G3]|eukprot:XP_001296105.1 hypothetical protein [Trichomonas vaginalis G3]
MSAIFMMIITELSTLIQLKTHCSYIIGVLLVIALQHQKEVAFTSKLVVIVLLFNENSVVQNAKAKYKATFHIQKLTKIT